MYCDSSKFFTSFIMRQGFFVLFSFIVCHNVVMGSTFTHTPNCDGMDPISDFKYLTAKSRLHCVVLCEGDNLCQSVQYGGGICYLNDIKDCSSNQITNSTLRYYQKNILCQNGGYMISSGCRCINGYVGDTCERLMIDCTEGWKSSHNYTTSKVYNIQPFASADPFQVYCKMQNGGRTLFQVHRSPSFKFNKTWVEYRDGFGSLTSNHWLGLQKMHMIINNGTYQMIVNMKLKNDSFYQHYFNDFQIENESNLYRLNFSNAKPHSTSPLGDSLTDSKGMAFSAFDQDNDNSTSNCAMIRGSGWWFNDCGPCNPNGELLNPTDMLKETEYEVFWTNDLQNTVPARMEMWFVKK